ncbi:MAG: Lysophospholipase, partial [Myxococcaceae bacterium]|nr:Lysophospholipase [Myxococcaceae bacterium]
YSDRYHDFATSLVNRGYAVYALDLRGHGDSEGDRVWVERFTDYLDDLELFLKRVRTAEAGKKVFLFGHSMGGAVVTLYTLTRDPKPAGLITSAAALKTEEPGAVTGPLKLIAAIFPKLAVFELKDENFSRDPKVVASMATDPLIYDAKGPARTAAEVLGAIATIREQAATLNVPVLALHGTKDLVTPPSGSKELIDAAKSTDKTLKSYDGLAHDLVHEPEKQQVMDDVGAWLDLHP